MSSPALRSLPSLSPLQVVSKYANICRTALIERLAYRGDFFFGTILRFLPMLTTILLWTAIFRGSGKDSLSGFRFNEMIAYLLLVHISRMFSSMPGLSTGIARDVRQGDLKKYLVQPLDMIGWLLAYRIAHKIAYIVTAVPPYAVIFGVAYSYFDTFPGGWQIPAYILALFLGFFIGFFFEVCMGCIGFWMLEVSSILYIAQTINFFVSGQMFPLDLLPGGWVEFLKALPFQYLAYFPAMVFLNKITGMQLVYGLLVGLGWALGCFLIARVLYQRGLKQYSSYGG
ncbi:MAG TPA: ABC-2 family transporter protein [Gemmatales bacterium]|nr:ABC-2 family transporter protein [Gemmatales bacterium]